MTFLLHNLFFNFDRSQQLNGAKKHGYCNREFNLEKLGQSRTPHLSLIKFNDTFYFHIFSIFFHLPLHLPSSLKISLWLIGRFCYWLDFLLTHPRVLASTAAEVNKKTKDMTLTSKCSCTLLSVELNMLWLPSG